MKKITLIAIIGLLFIFSGCKPQKKDLSALIVGEWELVGFEHPTKSIQIGDETVSVYLSFFKDDLGFSIRQGIGKGYAKIYTGSWTLSGNILSGKYKDGSDWGNTYTIDIVDNDTLYMTTSDSSEMYTYVRTQ